MRELRISGLEGIPEVQPGDDLAALILEALARRDFGDRRRRSHQGAVVLVVAQKVVSKAEGRIVRLEDVRTSGRAEAWAQAHNRDPRIVELALLEAKRIVRMDRGVLIAETRHGFVCANAGVDTSNAPPGCAVLLPEDPDSSARSLQERLSSVLGIGVGVVISDTFGRPWRQGLTNVALGVAGLSPFVDYRGRKDMQGRVLHSSLLAAADELAAAAELVMGKTEAVPVVLIEGYEGPVTGGSGRDLIRPAAEDLFR